MLTPKQAQKAFEYLKKKGVEFPFTVTLKLPEGSIQVTFQQDGTYQEATQ